MGNSMKCITLRGSLPGVWTLRKKPPYIDIEMGSCWLEDEGSSSTTDPTVPPSLIHWFDSSDQYTGLMADSHMTDLPLPDHSTFGAPAIPSVSEHGRCQARAFHIWEGVNEVEEASVGKTHMLCKIMDMYRDLERDKKRQCDEAEDMAIHNVNLQQQQQQSPQSERKMTPSSYHHMIAERGRRSKERDLIRTLHSLLPSGTAKKKDKNSIYQYAIDYIERLKMQVRVLQDHNKQLESSSAKFEEEVSKLSEPFSPGSMLSQEDGSSLVKICFDMNQRPKNPHTLLQMLNCVSELGFQVDSIHWNSSILSLTVHSMGDLGIVSVNQLRETLEKKMRWDVPTCSK